MVKIIKNIMMSFLLTANKKKREKEVVVEQIVDTIVEAESLTEELNIEDISTDLSEIEIEEEITVEITEPLKKEKHYLPKGEYLAGPTKKEWFFLHHTAGGNSPYSTIDNWARDNRGAVATEFLIGGQRITNSDAQFDGQVVKAFPAGGYGWHLGLGRRKVHTHSVGVELNNFGYLTQGGYYKTVEGKRTWIRKQPGKFYTYVGTEAHPDQVCDLGKKFRGHRYWHNYSDKQLEALKQLCLYVQERDGIDMSKGLPQLIRERGAFEAFDFCDVPYVEANPGLWCHTNVQRGKTDLYPHPKVIEILLSL
jgi:hypothetical protein